MGVNLPGSYNQPCHVSARIRLEVSTDSKFPALPHYSEKCVPVILGKQGWKENHRGGIVGILDLQKEWDEFGRIDPLWAIYSLPEKQGNKSGCGGVFSNRR
jgi:hypothetical protein